MIFCYIPLSDEEVEILAQKARMKRERRAPFVNFIKLLFWIGVLYVGITLIRLSL